MPNTRLFLSPARLFFDAIARNKNKDQGECEFSFCPAIGQSVAELSHTILRHAAR
jgi:hypothetical protein